MYFLSKAINDLGIKVVLSEGADEVLEAICILECLQQSFKRNHRVKIIYSRFMRADKSTMAQGLELESFF
jgi:asparagine synthetase B (glutamine-hydrolysing)